jgi:hypothetical protein
MDGAAGIRFDGDAGSFRSWTARRLRLKHAAEDEPQKLR